MPTLTPILARYWFVAPLIVLGLILTMAVVRVQHGTALSAWGGSRPLVADPKSPTGLERGQRQVLRAGGPTATFEWIVQTQAMLGQDGRLLTTRYDNAPEGRPVVRPAPYRGWLLVMAALDRVVSDRTLAESIERSARWADAALHAAVLVVLVLLTWWGFGPGAAVVMAVATGVLFPFAGRFVADQPDSVGLGVAAVVVSLLLLVWGVRRALATTAEPRGVRALVAAGFFGAIAGWILPVSLLVVLAGVVAAALAERVLSQRRRQSKGEGRTVRLAWRWWALGGGVGWFVASLVEGSFFSAQATPGAQVWQALAWWGGGELLATVDRWDPAPVVTRWRMGVRLLLRLGVPLTALAAGLAKVAGRGAELTENERLSNLPDSTVAPHTFAWLAEAGWSLPVVATILPALWIIATATWLVARTPPAQRLPISLLLGPLGVAMLVGLVELIGWTLLGGAALAIVPILLAAIIARHSSGPGVAWGGMAAIVMLPGLGVIWPPGEGADEGVVTDAEVRAFVARDLAYRLAQREDGAPAVVLAPPNLSLSLYYYGGLPVVVTPHPGNRAGAVAARGIALGTSLEHVPALAAARGLRYLVIPSWEPWSEGVAKPIGTEFCSPHLLGHLQRWSLPRWLRPVPYRLPNIPGCEGESVAVFEVVDEQKPATARARLVDYFLAMERPAQAAATVALMRQDEPTALETRLCRAQVAGARGEALEFGEALQDLLPALRDGADRELPWDRRVALAILLTQAGQTELARDQLARVWSTVDETKVRRLDAKSVHRLLVLSRVLHTPFPTPELRLVALEMLPAELRVRL